MTENPFEQFMSATTDEERTELLQQVSSRGYSFFRKILEGIRERVKTFSDEDVDDMFQLLDKAKSYFPMPGSVSPAWHDVWQELEQMITYKLQLLQAIPAAERDGVWQVILDNPYTNQEVVCYPHLTFQDAAYLYGFYRPTLVKNEYIEVQKVQSIIKQFGQADH